MKKFVKDGKVYYVDMTPDEAQKLMEFKFLKKVKNMSNEHILIAYIHEADKHGNTWKTKTIMKEILERMS